MWHYSNSCLKEIEIFCSPYQHVAGALASIRKFLLGIKLLHASFPVPFIFRKGERGMSENVDSDWEILRCCIQVLCFVLMALQKS